MKHLTFAAGLLCLSAWLPATTNAQDKGTDNAPETEFVMQLNVKLGQAYQEDGKNVIPITGGTFEGPALRGTVNNGGGDYQTYSNGVAHLDAIYSIRTDDGVDIKIRNQGIASASYFVAAPCFEAPDDSRYAWLNQSLFTCRPAGFSNGAIQLNVWRLKPSFQPTVQRFAPIPDAVRQPAAQQGKVETMYYTVRRADGTKLTKRAQVYLPHGYNKKQRHNVVYLMHGGGDNTTSFFADPRSPLPLTQVLDHLIADGKMKPVIVVAPTFYDDDTNIGANRMDDAIELCRRFHKELQHDLIPAVGRRYSTFLTRGDSLDIVKTRDHRAFGGFSMGSLTTWYQLAYGNNAVQKFLPLSGDLWAYDENGQKMQPAGAAAWLNARLASTPQGDDFQVFAYTGTDDIAGTPETNFVEALAAYAPLFRYGTPNANITFQLKDGGKHYYGDINEYLFHALPLLWK